MPSKQWTSDCPTSDGDQLTKAACPDNGKGYKNLQKFNKRLAIGEMGVNIPGTHTLDCIVFSVFGGMSVW